MYGSPCKDCGERKVGCHAACERYAAYHESRERVLQQRSSEIMLSGYHAEAIRKRKKGAGKKKAGMYQQ